MCRLSLRQETMRTDQSDDASSRSPLWELSPLRCCPKASISILPAFHLSASFCQDVDVQQKWEGTDAAEVGARPRLLLRAASSTFRAARTEPTMLTDARASWRGRRRGERDSLSATFELHTWSLISKGSEMNSELRSEFTCNPRRRFQTDEHRTHALLHLADLNEPKSLRGYWPSAEPPR